MRRLLMTALVALAAIGTGQAAEVTDDTGRQVRIPDDPQRVVALHEPVLAVPLIELGVPIVGIYGRGDDGSSLTAVDFLHEMLGRSKDADPIPGIGPVGSINLEKLRALRPDLIIGTDYDAGKAKALSQAAPVYLQNSSAATAHGFSVQEELARVLHREDRFRELRTAYQARLDELRGRFPDRLPKAPGERTYLTVMLTDQANVVAGMSGAVQALEDLGYRRAEIAGEGSTRQSRSMLILPIGAESLAGLNPDLLLVMTSFAAPARDEAAARAALDRLSPGWDRFMAPAREGRVVFLDSARVTSPSVASAMHTLDAVEGWLAGGPR